VAEVLVAISMLEVWPLAFAVGAAAIVAIAIERTLRLRDELKRTREALHRAELTATADGIATEDPVSQAKVPAPLSTRAPIDQPVAPDDLVQAISAGEVVLFAGAGIAAEAGYPLYAEALGLVIDRLGRGDDENWTALRRQLDAGEVERTAELLRSRVGEDGIRDALRSAVAPAANPCTPTLEALAHLHFAGVITDDWYGVIASRLGRGASLLAPWSSGAATEVLRLGRSFVLEAYGGLERGRVVVGIDDYRSELYDNRDYARFVASLLTTRSLLFLGTGLRGVEQFLVSSEVRTGGERLHWALVPWQPDFDLEQERLMRYGVRLLPYEPDDPANATARFVAYLRERLGDGPTQPPARIGAAGKVESLTLKNIGPFSQLSLTFAGQRTILLGDNGCGKSSVLRAIALALAGESPVTDRLAERMLKTEESSGEIEVGVGKDVFRTRLSREGSRVRLRSESFTPVQASAWLAVGFPPLRGVSSENPRGPTTEAAAGPGPDDLIPLLADTPDTRLDSLKQWVVNAELRAEDSSSKAAPRQRKMLDKFFEIVRALTPGVDFEYRGVDRTTWAIQLKSDDGPVSFDLLSRGITAVLGWVGVLLQRLYEVYENEEEPWTGSVLVLVDELDVHLHPEWQRMILPLLHRHFPGMQLIATTHSPLVVTDAEVGEVISLRREADGIEVEVIQQSFTGLRSDQILTSAAFDMDSTRDYVTGEKLRAYRDLLADGRTPETDEEARALAASLKSRTGPVEETPHEQRATVLLREWLQERLSGMPDDDRKKIIGAAEDYFEQLGAGGRREAR